MSVQEARVDIDRVNLKFRIYSNRSPNLKEVAINLLRKNESPPSLVEFYALKNFSLSVQSGERVGVMGLNGAGKSTLLKTIAGIYPPQSGTIHVAGKLTPLIELGTGFDEDLSGRENIYLNGTMLKNSRKTMMSLEEKIIEFADLGKFIDLPIKYYSSGMRSRLALSIAFMVPSQVVLLDEIFATGDRVFVEKATKRFFDVLNSSNIVFFVSHDPMKLLEVSTRIIVIHEGELRFDGEPLEALKFYETEIVGNDWPAETVESEPMEPETIAVQEEAIPEEENFAADPAQAAMMEAFAANQHAIGPEQIQLMMQAWPELLSHYLDYSVTKYVGWQKQPPNLDELSEEDRRIYEKGFHLWEEGRYTESLLYAYQPDVAKPDLSGLRSSTAQFVHQGQRSTGEP